MAELSRILLGKVRNAVALRDSNTEKYQGSFKNAYEFVAATINGKLEFVPVSLLFIGNNLYLTQHEISCVFGSPQPQAQLDDRLISFYNEHGLKRDLEDISNPVNYHIKPKQPAPVVQEDDFFNPAELMELSAYSGASYSAKDDHLKSVGQAFANHAMKPTNDWGEKMLSDGFTLETERYWQVAGYFKTFTWAKLVKSNARDNRIFLSVGVDLKQKSLVFKLDCLRSGSNKLANLEIRKFDYYTQDRACSYSIPFDYIEHLNWNSLTDITNQFITDFINIYEGVSRYVWLVSVDSSLFSNKLFLVSDHYESPETITNEQTLEPEDYSSILELVIDFEKFMLNHADKEDLAALVQKSEDGWHQISTYEFDGTRKKVIVIPTTGGTNSAFNLASKTVFSLTNDDHAYLYHVVEYNKEKKTGKLIIRKGDPSFYAKLEPTMYNARI